MFGNINRWSVGSCLLVVCGTAVAAEPIPPTVRLLVPAYFYPADEGLREWKQLIRSAAQAPITAIVNPDSGPGKRVDPNYSEIFELAANTRLKLIGYVTLSYAKRPVSSVKAEIDSWLHFYPGIQGIFFDEQPSGAQDIRFVDECFAYARQNIDKAELVSNPGVVCAREYLDSPHSPTVCLFEHHAGFEDFRLPNWADPFPPSRIAVLHYGLKSPDDMRRILRAALQQGAGYVFLTDRPGPMPWDALPSYWQEELDSIAKTNQMIDVPQRTAVPKR